MPQRNKRFLSFAVSVALLSIVNEAFAGSYTPLSPPSIFQEDAIKSSLGKKRSMLSDLRLFTVIFEIGEYFFVDKMPQERLKEAMKFRFSNNPDFLRGVKLGGVRHVEDVVYVPYLRDGRRYVVKISDRGIIPPWQASDRLRSERFRVVVLEPPISKPNPLP